MCSPSSSFWAHLSSLTRVHCITAVFLEVLLVRVGHFSRVPLVHGNLVLLVVLHLLGDAQGLVLGMVDLVFFRLLLSCLVLDLSLDILWDDLFDELVFFSKYKLLICSLDGGSLTSSCGQLGGSSLLLLDLVNQIS